MTYSAFGEVAEENHTEQVTELTLVGLTDNPRLQAPLFLLFLLVYFTTLAGNLGMVARIRSHGQLQSPMYFFLSNLSLPDACYSSVVALRTLMNLLMRKKTISLATCATQLFFIAFGITRCFLLAVMAYNHYTAICNPLLYPAVMSHSVCILLVASLSVLGLPHSSVHMDLTFSLPFCRPAEVNHFYCNLVPVLALSCFVSSTSTRVSPAGLVEMVTILAVLVSYTFILSAVSKISPAKGQRKAFSTCTSHLAGVTIFQGSIITLNFRPRRAKGKRFFCCSVSPLQTRHVGLYLCGVRTHHTTRRRPSGITRQGATKIRCVRRRETLC